MASEAKFTIRSAQMMSPFGVGSLVEIDGQSFFVRGTHKWQETVSLKGSGENYQDFKNLSDINFSSWGGSDKLKRVNFHVPVIRFPTWHFCPNCNRMEKLTYQHDTQAEDNATAFQRSTPGFFPTPKCRDPKCKGKQLAPMRFVAVCKNGHLDEIDWSYLAHRHPIPKLVGQCGDKKTNLRFITKKGAGGDFSNMHIVCINCSSELGPCEHNNLETLRDSKGIKKCRGYHPGESENMAPCEDEGKPVYMEMQPRGAQSLHIPSLLSSLDISMEKGLDSEIERIRGHQNFDITKNNFNHLLERNGSREMAIQAFEFSIEQIAADCGSSFKKVLLVIEEDQQSPQDEITGQRLSQAEILNREFPVLATASPINSGNLVSIPQIIDGDDILFKNFSKIVQVERLREVRIFTGFQRLEFGSKNPVVEPHFGKTGVNWLPAQEVFGEGIFFQFNEQSMRAWETKYEKQLQIATELQIEKASDKGLLVKEGLVPSARFIMLHTFAHIIITQLSFDCGYSSTSLKERIYCDASSDGFGGVLIYTSDADSQGAMGGLVEMGEKRLIENVIHRALIKSTWCSGDPVCRELKSQGVSGLNAAACHACSLIAETSCGHNNILLNRLLVSGDGRTNGRGSEEPIGFFQNLL